jgi:hypothetical protein
MESKEKEQWRLLGAFFAMNGLVSSGFTGADLPAVSFRMADDMLDYAEQNVGIVTVKKRGKK